MFRRPGLRFRPTDQELLLYYLKRKVVGKSYGDEYISELGVYRYNPCDLPLLSPLKKSNAIWYFITPTNINHLIAQRSMRAANGGFWKVSGKDKFVKIGSRIIGYVKTLKFHITKQGNTNWMMYEYTLDDAFLNEEGVVPQEYCVLNMVLELCGKGKKIKGDHGGTFLEEDWETDDEEEKNVFDDGTEEGEHLGLVLTSFGQY